MVVNPNVRQNLIHKVVTHSKSGNTGIVADSRYDGLEIRVKCSEGGSVSDWMNVWSFDIRD